MAIETPHPVDLHVGSKIRARRRQLGITQVTLAEALGLTFQQVQKYETGRNRISASVLHSTAKTLQVPEDNFFAGLDPDCEPFEAVVAQQALFLNTAEGRDLAEAFAKLSPGMKRRILGVVKEASKDNVD